MRFVDGFEKKIMTIDQAKAIMHAWKITGKTVSFTNGCFDILHPGHLFSIAQAAKEADYLVVGLNSDASIKKIKGPDRPINNTASRAIIIANLAMVDAVIIFEEDTPYALIQSLKPKIIVKGGDYEAHAVVGSDLAEVRLFPYQKGHSTTEILRSLPNN